MLNSIFVRASDNKVAFNRFMYITRFYSLTSLLINALQTLVTVWRNGFGKSEATLTFVLQRRDTLRYRTLPERLSHPLPNLLRAHRVAAVAEFAGDMDAAVGLGHVGALGGREAGQHLRHPLLRAAAAGGHAR